MTQPLPDQSNVRRWDGGDDSRIAALEHRCARLTFERDQVRSELAAERAKNVARDERQAS